MGQIKFIGSLLLVSVFAVAVTMFAINFANDNETAFNLGNEEGYNETSNSIQTNLSDYRTKVINSSKSAYEVTITTGDTSTSGTPLRMGAGEALGSVKIATRQGWRVIFGDDSQFGFILTALISFLTFMAIVLWWKTWAGRNPE